MSAVTSATDLGRHRAPLPPAPPRAAHLHQGRRGFGSLGLLSAVAVAQRPVGCIANGQRVPEDIHGPVRREDLVNLILGESQWVQGRSE